MHYVNSDKLILRHFKLQLAILFHCIIGVLISYPIEAKQELYYYSAADLELDYINNKVMCNQAITGVLGAIAYLNATDHMKDVLCLPKISVMEIRAHYRSWMIDRREETKEMLAGAALMGMIYYKYPCPKERERRKNAGENAAKELREKYGK